MNLIKAAIVGALASLLMLGVFLGGLYGMGLHPLAKSPVATLSETFGFELGLMPLLIHFAYGMFWSMVLVTISGAQTNLLKGMVCGVSLWLVMILVYWATVEQGVFGGEDVAPEADEDPIPGGMAYLGLTFVAHLVYGVVIGWINPRWIRD